MNNSVKNSREVIEKVLAGLRNVEPPAGMERRTLDGLEERDRETRVRWFGFDFHGVPVSYAASGVALAVFVLTLAIPVIRRFGHTPAQPRIDVAAVMTTPWASSSVAVVVPEHALHGQRVWRIEADSRGTGLVRVAGSVASSSADSEESVARSEMRAASFPAPPIPLTEQERLLLRVAHRGDREELAMLDPEARELSEVEEKAEFQRFFAQASAEEILARQVAMEQAARNPEAGDQATATQSTKEQITKESGTERSTPEHPDKDQLIPGQSVIEKPAPSTTEQATPRQLSTGENK